MDQASVSCINGEACQLTQDTYCLRVVTGGSSNNDGTLTVSADVGGGLFEVASGSFSKDQGVVSQCYSSPVVLVEVKNPTTDAWTGSVEYSSNAGGTFNAMQCSKGCHSPGSTASIVVDGDGDGTDQASVSCINGEACQLTQDTYCLRVVTGGSSNNDGTLTVSADVGGGLFEVASGSFSKEQGVVSQCYSRPVVLVEVKNPTRDAWTGSVEYSSNAGGTFNAMQCSKGCQSPGSTARIVVDGDNDGTDQASVSCINGGACQVTPTPVTCMIGTSTTNPRSDPGNTATFPGETVCGSYDFGDVTYYFGGYWWHLCEALQEEDGITNLMCCSKNHCNSPVADR